MSLVAVVPAAGLSLRMGRPKLTLPLGGRSVISLVVESLRLGGVGRVIVVIRPPRDAASAQLERDAKAAGAEVLVCDPPPEDMRASVEYALESLKSVSPRPAGILLCPADSPGVTAGLVERVVRKFTENSGSIVIPEHDGKRGHPVAIPWDLALSIPSLPPGYGVNELHVRHADRRLRLPVSDVKLLADLDTPEDYRAWVARLDKPPQGD